MLVVAEADVLPQAVMVQTMIAASSRDNDFLNIKIPPFCLISGVFYIANYHPQKCYLVLIWAVYHSELRRNLE